MSKDYLDNMKKVEEFFASQKPLYERLFSDLITGERLVMSVLKNTDSGWKDAPVKDGSKDHIIREVVNSLRDTAVKYGSTQQLRERLRTAIQPLLEAEAKTLQTTEEQLAAVQEVVLGYMSDSHGLEQGDAATLRITEAFLAAAKQPYTTDSDRYKAELYDEVWAKARTMGYENVTMALHDLAVAKQKAARWDKVLGSICAERDVRPGKDTCYFLLSRVVGHVPKGVNPMKGSVAGHFTDHIDNLIKTKPAVS